MRYVATRWKLKELLEREEVTVMQLSETMPSKSKPASLRVQLYTITSPDPTKHPNRVDFGFLTSVLDGLALLKGRKFDLNDILEYQSDVEVAK